MEARDIVRIARKRAGLSQEQLARRSGMHRNVISRWERGESEPSLRTLRRVVRACELDLVTQLAVRDPSLEELVADQLELVPAERMNRLLPENAFQPVLSALDWVADAPTSAIVIGDIAAILQGSPQRPVEFHVEVVSDDPYSTEMELRAGEFAPLDSESRWRDLDRRHPWRRSDGAVISIASNLPGLSGYVDLSRSADMIDVGRRGPRGLRPTVRVAHPRDLLLLAEASPRGSARAQVPGLRALLARRSIVTS